MTPLLSQTCFPVSVNEEDRTSAEIIVAEPTSCRARVEEIIRLQNPPCVEGKVCPAAKFPSYQSEHHQVEFFSEDPLPPSISSSRVALGE